VKDIGSLKWKINNKTQGFTLIETLIYTGLIGLVMVVFINYAFTLASAGNKNRSMREVNGSIRRLVEIISGEVRRSEAIVSPRPGEVSDELTLLDSDGRMIIFDREEGDLIYRRDGSPSLVLGGRADITGLDFLNLGGTTTDCLKFSGTVEYGEAPSEDFRYERSFQTAVNRRP
jgi:type II secretory pathway pseudopilin PulG